jgi:hypothetical protein
MAHLTALCQLTLRPYMALFFVMVNITALVRTRTKLLTVGRPAYSCSQTDPVSPIDDDKVGLYLNKEIG